jgi:hypothetical protein
MKKVLFIGLVLFTGTVFFGYAKSPKKLLTEQYPERWEKTYIGMSLDEFKTIWPEAKYGCSGDLQNTTEIWTFSPPYKAFSTKDIQMLFFTFEKNILIKFREQ